MFSQDLPYIFSWWSIIFLLGAIFFPLTNRLFASFIDRGYIFSKILGILVFSYLVWVLGILRLLPFSKNSLYLLMGILIVIDAIFLFRSLRGDPSEVEGRRSNLKNLPVIPDLIGNPLNNSIDSRFRGNDKGKKVTRNDKQFISLILFEELLFTLALLLWSWVKGHQPDLIGLEKFMDFGFINSLLRAKYFPPLDMWLSQSPTYSGHFINYYYFGHLVTAVLTKLTSINPAITFNLMLATVFAFCFTGSFSIGLNLITYSLSLRGASETSDEAISKNANMRLPRPFGARNDSIKNGVSVFTIIAGFLTAFLVTLAGNLHTIYAFLKPYIPADKPIPFWQLPLQFNFSSYWYPNATRFIPYTIHEFPSYSFVVSDLHGHVLDIPFVLLTIALLLSYVLQKTNPSTVSQNSLLARELARNKQIKMQNDKSKFKINNHTVIPAQAGIYTNKSYLYRFLIKSGMTIKSLLTFDFLLLIFLGLLLAIMYMTNAWDGLIYFGLSALVFLYTILCHSERRTLSVRSRGIFLNNPLCRRSLHSPAKGGFGRDDIIGGVILTTKYQILLLLLFVIFSLPFHLTFKPFVFGIGVVRDHSPIWMLAILWGFFYFCVAGFLVSMWKSAGWHPTGRPKIGVPLWEYFWGCWVTGPLKQRKSSVVFILLLIILSSALLIFPELFYVKDIYPLHYRANTMFKLGYQAFIMLSLASGYIIALSLRGVKRRSNLFPELRLPRPSPTLGARNDKIKKILTTIYPILLLLLLFLVSLYPYFSINSYFGNLKTYQGLYGLSYLNKLYPDDYQAILWLNKNVTGQPVILEAVGDSYTDYARVSANTGLPTVLGWPVHEWLWRGSYDEAGKRVEEVKNFYSTPDVEQARKFIKKYQVKYVFIGQLEKQKYPQLNEEKFSQAGTVVFQAGETKIYKMND